MAHAVWPHRTIIQLAIMGVCQGNQIVNVHHFQVGTARETTLTNDNLAFAAAEELAADWLANVKDTWIACHTTDYSIVQLRSQVIERPGNRNHRLTPAEVAPGTGSQGTVAIPAEDFHTAAVLRWRTNRAGKSFRGRTYVGPLSPQWESDGRLTAAAQPIISAYGQDVKSRWAVGGTDHDDFALTIYSRPYDKYGYGYVKGQGANRQMFWPEDYDGNATNVTTFALDPALRVQRRREVGVGS